MIQLGHRWSMSVTVQHYKLKPDTFFPLLPPSLYCSFFLLLSFQRRHQVSGHYIIQEAKELLYVFCISMAGYFRLFMQQDENITMFPNKLSGCELMACV